MSEIYPGGDAQYSTNLGLALWGADAVVVENFILIDAAVGGGSSSVKVNGSVITNPNFNGTTPAAPGGNTNVTFQVDGSGNISAYVPTSGTVTSFSAGNFDAVATTSVTNPTTTPALTFTLTTQAANSFWAGPTTGAAAAPTFRAIGAGDIPSGTVLLNQIGNPSGNTVINITTHNVNLEWTNPAATFITYNLQLGTTTPATSVSNTNSPAVGLFGSYWTGSISSTNEWRMQDILGSGANPTTTLTISQVGSSGVAAVQVPNLSFSTPSGEAGIIDNTGSFGLAGQVLTSQEPGVLWVTPSASGGTVTTFSAGALSPLFTTSVATATTTPALSFSLSNAAQNSVFAGPSSGGAGAPSYRALVAGDIPSLSSIYLPLAGGTLSGNLTLQSTLTDGVVSVGTSGMILSSTGTGVLWVSPGSVGASWSSISSATTNLVLNNTTFNTTFNQTSAAVWDWANTTPTVTGAATTVALSTSAAPTNPSGNNWIYTLAATESGAGTNGWAGAKVTIAGYTGSATGNNGTNLVVTASTTTTVTVTNTTGTTVNTGAPTMISTAVTSSPLLELSATINSGTAGTLNSVADTWALQVIPGSVVPNPTSTLAITHTGTTGVSAVQVPAGAPGTASAWGLTFAGASVGLAAASTVLSVLGANPILRIYNGATNTVDLAAAAAGTFNSLGATLSSAPTNSTVTVQGNITTTIGSANVVIGGASILAGTTAGTQTGVAIGTGLSSSQGFLSFAPASGATNFTGLLVSPVINQTSSASGNYTGILVNVIETALKGTANSLLTLQAGTSGSTTKFSVSNSGIVSNYDGIATVANGIPATYVTSLLTAQSAAISAHTLVLAASSFPKGMWRISYVATVTTAATAAGVLGGATGFQINFTNANGDTVAKTTSQTVVTSVGTSTADTVSGDLYCYAGAGTAVTYSFGYTAGTGTPMAYDIAVYAEFLG